jgi:hypothetical protein
MNVAASRWGRSDSGWTMQPRQLLDHERKLDVSEVEMKTDYHLYIDVEDLRGRGWTETLTRQYLGAPDRWASVNYWANYTGKRTYFLERVHLVEDSEAFQDAFTKSIKRRKIDHDEVNQFLARRRATRNDVRKWRESLSNEDKREIALLAEAASLFEAARRRGYRTPHK